MSLLVGCVSISEVPPGGDTGSVTEHASAGTIALRLGFGEIVTHRAGCAPRWMWEIDDPFRVDLRYLGGVPDYFRPLFSQHDDLRIDRQTPKLLHQVGFDISSEFCVSQGVDLVIE